MKTSTLLAASAATLFALSTAYGGVDASGGIITQVGNDLVHTFTESGTLEVTQGGMVEVLVVGGGGGGGSDYYGGGGGGGGGIVYRESYAVEPGSYTVTVGAGGAGGAAGKYGSNGGDSSIFGLVASGGGYGGGYNSHAGGVGGSGGGASGMQSGSSSGGASTSGQGYNGGSGIAKYAGGGGGGGSAGNNGTTHLTAHTGITLCGMGGRLLVTNKDMVERLLLATGIVVERIVDRHDGPTWVSEDGGHALGLQRAHQRLGSCYDIFHRK